MVGGWGIVSLTLATVPTTVSIERYPIMWIDMGLNG